MYHSMGPKVCSGKFTLCPKAWGTRVVSYTPFPASQSLLSLPVSFADHQGTGLHCPSLATSRCHQLGGQGGEGGGAPLELASSLPGTSVLSQEAS